MKSVSFFYRKFHGILPDRARDTSIFLHIFSLQHFNLLLLSDPMFPFSIFISLFSNRSSSLKPEFWEMSDNYRKSVHDAEIWRNFPKLICRNLPEKTGNYKNKEEKKTGNYFLF